MHKDLYGLEFPKIRVTILGAPHNKDCNILGSILKSPYLGKLLKLSYALSSIAESPSEHSECCIWRFVCGQGLSRIQQGLFGRMVVVWRIEHGGPPKAQNTPVPYMSYSLNCFKKVI